MTRSKRLVCGAANRQITFYDLTSTNYFVPTSTIKDLVALPTCMEYYRWPEKTEGKIETLLVGDSLGNVHKYDFKYITKKQLLSKINLQNKIQKFEYFWIIMLR